eukprot:655860-Rhodomonas_salina.1
MEERGGRGGLRRRMAESGGGRGEGQDGWSIATVCESVCERKEYSSKNEPKCRRVGGRGDQYSSRKANKSSPSLMSGCRILIASSAS